VDCECLPTCIFFNDKMANMPGLSDLFKKKYCRGDSRQCARYLVFKGLGRANVPPDLYPNQVERARTLVAGK
jgi:hypothetical protein